MTVPRDPNLLPPRFGILLTVVAMQSGITRKRLASALSLNVKTIDFRIYMLRSWGLIQRTDAPGAVHGRLVVTGLGSMVLD